MDSKAGYRFASGSSTGRCRTCAIGVRWRFDGDDGIGFQRVHEGVSVMEERKVMSKAIEMQVPNQVLAAGDSADQSTMGDFVYIKCNS